MTVQTLDDVYTEHLQDAHSACKQSLAVTTELGRAASDKALSEALIAGSNGIAEGMSTLAELCAEHDVDPEGERCKAMEGMAREARLRVLETDYGDEAARDAMIVAQYQRMAHYAIAVYGSLVAFANRLGFDADGAKLKDMLASAYGGDRRMTDIATGGVNEAATA